MLIHERRPPLARFGRAVNGFFEPYGNRTALEMRVCAQAADSNSLLEAYMLS